MRAPRASASCVRRAEPEDGEARNTLGDLSRSFGRQLARRVKEAKDQVNSLTGKDAYEFGDLSRWLDAKAKERVNAVTGKDEYEFGDVSRWLDAKAKDGVNAVTGKDEYEFGDVSRWLDAQAKDRVNAATGKDEYAFGDLTREIVRRASAQDYSMRDVSMLLKALLAFRLGLSPIGALLPVKFLVDLLNYSLLADVGEKLAGYAAMEIDKRLKKALTGDENYRLGDLTMRAVLRFTGKDAYAFGDVSRAVMDRATAAEASGDATPTLFGAPADGVVDVEARDDGPAPVLGAGLASELATWDAASSAGRDEALASWDARYVERSVSAVPPESD